MSSEKLNRARGIICDSDSISKKELPIQRLTSTFNVDAPDLELLLLGTELSLSSRGRMTLGVRVIFWFISHTLPQCHVLQGIGDTYL
jgi:hypothetical protein